MKALCVGAGLLLSAAGSLASASAARADVTPDQCVQADTAAQNDRRAGHLRAARDDLAVCSAAACPKLVREDCAQRASDLEAAIPTIVFGAIDAHGDDVVAVRVAIDGKPLTSELAGSPVAVDPGLHTFTFEVDGAPAVQKKYVIREGEKGRQERVTFGAAGATALPVVPAAGASPSESDSPSPSGRTQKIVGIVLGGAGVALLVMGAIEGAMSFSSWSSAQSACSSTACPNHVGAVSDHDSAQSQATISDIGFIGGGVLVAAGAVTFFTAPSRASDTASKTAESGFRLLPSLGPNGGGLRLQGTF